MATVEAIEELAVYSRGERLALWAAPANNHVEIACASRAGALDAGEGVVFVAFRIGTGPEDTPPDAPQPHDQELLSWL